LTDPMWALPTPPGAIRRLAVDLTEGATTRI
jgi:hypothetical protein